jgi:Flp pilus assembly protein TadD
MVGAVSMRSKPVTLAGLALVAAALAGFADHALASGPDMMQSATFAGQRVNAKQELQRGEAALQAGAYKDAEDSFRRLSELTPGDADVWYDLGQAASALGQDRTAEHAYSRSVALDPTSIDNRREFALALVKIKQNPKAAAQLDALKALAVACKDRCNEAYELRTAIATVEGALAN